MLLSLHKPTDGGILLIALNTVSIGNFNSYDLCLSLRKVKNLILDGKFIRLKMLAMLCCVPIAAYVEALAMWRYSVFRQPVTNVD